MSDFRICSTSVPHILTLTIFPLEICKMPFIIFSHFWWHGQLCNRGSPWPWTYGYHCSSAFGQNLGNSRIIHDNSTWQECSCIQR